MKTFFSSKWLRFAAGAVLAALVTVSSLAFAPAAVYAQDGGPTTQKTPLAGADDKGEKRNVNLERAYAREQARLLTQGNHFSQAAGAASKLGQFIEKARANGRDVSGLESALSTFNTQIAAARLGYEQAKSILAAHNGFDSNGKVTDPAAAKTTVESAHKSLTDAHVGLRQAGADLRAAVRAWREANPPVKKTPKP